MSAEVAMEVGRLYSPLKTIADVVTASQGAAFHKLPGLEAYWPMGVRSNSGSVTEHSGNALPLLETGNSPVGFDGNAFAVTGAGTNYVGTAGGLQATGLESWIDSSIRGLTWGGWVFVLSSPSSISGIAGKDAITPDRGYSLNWSATDSVRCDISGTGAAVFTAILSGQTTAVWHFVIGRFIPSVEVALFVDGVKNTSTAGIPASLNVSAANFEMGRFREDNTRILNVRLRDMFLCRAALSDEVIANLRSVTAP